ncbi:HDOD domain-containing protein [Shewanella avicenniae]|nr:HDOD domain-containing protein [Shewanella avicenniae]
MPALCSMVRSLEQLAKDDVSSMAALGRSIMYDNALTSRVLRVANSAIYNKGISQVTTVSRAAVVLGFDVIRNVCITAKLLTSLLDNKNLSENVYHRLIRLMAQSFQAAMFTKMMLADHDEEFQEEAFIAALLYHLGESAFWSTGGPIANELDKELITVDDSVQRLNLVRQHIGTSFSQLTQGLARSWGLGELLMKSLTSPNDRTPEVRSIYLGNKLAEAFANASKDPQQLQKRIQQAAEMLKLPNAEFQKMMLETIDATSRLAVDYGAKELVAFLPDTQSALATLEQQEQWQPRQPNMTIQLEKLRELTNLTMSKPDFNQVVTVALSGMLEGVGLDRAAVMLMSPNRKMLQPRVVMGDGGDTLKAELILQIDPHFHELKACLEHGTPFWMGHQHGGQKLPASIDKVLPDNGWMFAPLRVENKVIGVFYADRATSGRDITQAEFDSFHHFVQLTNVCFSLAYRS